LPLLDARKLKEKYGLDNKSTPKPIRHRTGKGGHVMLGKVWLTLKNSISARLGMRRETLASMGKWWPRRILFGI
jgi:hypothetical protein